MKQTFLHLSDLHYKSNWFEEQELIFEKFADDLILQIKHYSEPYAVFSGDLVSAADEPNLYDSVVLKVATLLDHVGIPMQRRICIPGNHDVSRAALKPNLTIQKGALSAIRDEEAFNRDLEQLSSLLFTPKFHAYAAAEAKIADLTCTQSRIGGSGWELPMGIGVYCLNTGICSFAGLEDPETGQKISDKDRLMIDTRSLHQWLQNTPSTVRVLVMHHPFDWLAPWAKTQVENIVSDKFRVVLSGHIHQGSSIFSTHGSRGAVHCVAPALFTRKRDDLGYSFVTIDTATEEVEIAYRQKTPKHNFVLGVDLAENDSGRKVFPPFGAAPVTPHQAARPISADTLAVLQAEFDEARLNYSTKHLLWVDRDLSTVPETARALEKPAFIDPAVFAQSLKNAVIHAPQQYGLSCLGRYFALELHKSDRSRVALVCDLVDVPTHRQGVIKYVEERCKELATDLSSVETLILDNWQRCPNPDKILRIIAAEFPRLSVVILQAFDDFQNIGNSAPIANTSGYQVLYLWSLTRNRIRQLVTGYLDAAGGVLDEDVVTNKITNDIDALNIHRTPINCLLILKLVERAFDDTPVNRTEVISKVLYFLFHEYDKIPTYSVRPDLKDCEYALGFLSEWMIRNGKGSFTQNEFTDQVRQYCTSQMIELEVGILFSFLVSENILVRRGIQFTFRFSYWLYYFAAHRMYHSSEFADFILGEMRYAAFPEIIEFYTGIDRRRTDAVTTLTADLDRMDAQFLDRTRIDNDLDPFRDALWSPSAESIKKLKQDVVDSIQESSLPASVKDAAADQHYDSSKPFRQDIAQFIDKASVDQMVRAMRGAARALRNSDHVLPAARLDLLNAVMRCWTRVCQILVILSPMLTVNRRAAFEDIGFYLMPSFDKITDELERWRALMSVIADNVVGWYETDISSKKLAPLYRRYIDSNRHSMGELLMMILLVKQRPAGWESLVKSFILREDKNSYYLARVHINLWNEFRIGFASEAARQELRTLAAITVAKHETGAKNPNQKMIAKAAEFIDERLKKTEDDADPPGQS